MAAATLEGDAVVNSQVDELGKVSDIMIDVRSGRIAYAVLSFGGVLGVGGKLFAIPWGALTRRRPSASASAPEREGDHP
jgi:sporulation protein YlmC with PRC-barrel domain